MKEWLSAQESADAHKMSKAGFIKMATRKQYKTRQRIGRGGGLEYASSSFPIEIQAALLKAESRAVLAAELPQALMVPKPTLPALPPDPALKNAGDAQAAHLTGDALARMNAKVGILIAFRRFVAEHPAQGRQRPGGTQHKEAFAAAWNRGEIESPARAVIPQLTTDKLDRWPTHLRHAGLSALAGNYGNRRGQTVIDQHPQLAVALKALMLETPHVRATFAYEVLRARYGSTGSPFGEEIPVPSIKTVARWMNDWKAENHSLYCKISDPDRWKSTYQSAIGDASAAIIALNQEWQADSTPADIQLADGRHALIFLLDVYSRRLKIQVSKTSTAAAIAAVLRRGLIDWGQPKVLKTDNGQDYVSHHIDSICHTLGIERHLCAPFTPEGKGHVERHVRTFSHDLLELLPGYSGHNVAEAQRLRAREQFSDRIGVKGQRIELRLTAEQLQEFCDRWCEGYHHRPHRGLDGKTPNQMVTAWPDPIRRIADDRVLDLLLAPVPSNNGWRVVSKSDQLKIDGFTYVAAELALHINDRVQVKYDETDMGRVYVFDGFGRFIAIAECPEVSGLNRRELAREYQSIQKTHLQRQVRDAKNEARKVLKGPALLEAVLEGRVEQARLIASDSVSTGDRALSLSKGIEHTTPYTEGAQKALAGHTEHCGSGFTPQEARAMGYFDALPEPPPEPVAPPAPVTVFETPFAAMRDLFKRAMNGQQRPGDALFTAEFYAEHRKPHLFENQMIDDVGWEKFYAWKTDLLAQAKAEIAALPPQQQAG